MRPRLLGGACLVVYAACAGHTPRVQPDTPVVAMHTDPFVPLLCTSGLPGDPTCPYNHVLIDVTIGTTLLQPEIDYIAQPLASGQLSLIDGKLVNSVIGLAISKLFVEESPCSEPAPVDAPSIMTTSGVTPLPDLTVNDVQAGEICIAFASITPF